MLVKELQGLGLKVDLIESDKIIDAEEVLAENIKGEAANLSDVEVPQPEASNVDVTEDAAVDEFMVMDLEDELPEGGEPSLVAADGSDQLDDESEEAK